jgi:hypothetical protein
MDTGDDEIDESIFLLGFADAKSEVPSAAGPAGQSPTGP